MNSLENMWSLSSQITIIMDLLHRFYETDHINEHGVSMTYTMEFDYAWIQYLLYTLFTSGAKSIHPSEYKELLWAFNKNCLQYMIEYLNMTSYIDDWSLKVCFFKLENYIHEIHVLEKKHYILQSIRKNISSNLQNIDTIKNSIEKKIFADKITILSHYYPIHALIEWKDKQISIISVTKWGEISFLYDVGNGDIQKFIFSDPIHTTKKQRIFIVTEYDNIIYEEWLRIIQAYKTYNPIAIFQDFVIYIEKEYDIRLDVNKVVHNEFMEYLLTDCSDELLWTIVARMWYLSTSKKIQKKLLVYNADDTLVNIWTYKDITKPTKVPEWFKWKWGFSCITTDFYGKQQAIVSNGFETDKFDIHEE